MFYKLAPCIIDNDLCTYIVKVTMIERKGGRGMKIEIETGTEMLKMIEIEIETETGIGGEGEAEVGKFLHDTSV